MSVFVFAQTLSSNLSKDKIALGETAIYRVSINNLEGKNVQTSPKNELLPFHFEENKDEIKITPDYYDRTIEFAIYEEGRFTIPELEFLINGEVLKTVSYEITVYNPANATDPLNDIMNNKKVQLTLADYWELYKIYVFVILGILVLLILAFLLKKKGIFKKSQSPKKTVHKTLKELEQLRQKKYMENGGYRSFYVELIDISRRFLSEQYHIPAEVLLTDDLVDLMKKTNTISQENEQAIEEIFYRGDLVKFAKIFPNQTLMEQDYQSIYNVVKRSIEDVEAEQLRTIHS